MRRVTAWVIVVGLSAATPIDAQPRDVAAMITEIKPGRGRIEVSGPGASEWRPAGPLLALKVGDRLRATEDAAAVVVLAGRRGSVQVDAARSPFVVTASPADSKLQKAFLLLEGGLGFLGSDKRETPRPVLSTRTLSRPPVILSPRGGPVLPDALAFEWQGYRFARYALRVVGPSGVVLERAGLTGSRLAYPADAPPLAPGTAYTLQLFSGQSRVDEVRFEVAERQRADDLRRDLGEVEQTLGPDVPASSRAVMQAGVLASRGFLHDARRVVVAALATDADQPSLHAVLGDLYARTGLPREADEAYEQARALASPAAR
ncbi:MAG TPA: hypothetical protein VIE41_06200 [Methylomirabilota bacterium]|jgi:hypothetical protein